jgi:hypothetical protein
MFLRWSEFCYRAIVWCSENCFQRRKKREREREGSSSSSSFFSYVNVFLTKAVGEKRDATHTGGSVNRLLVVSDEQATSKCAAEM